MFESFANSERYKTKQHRRKRKQQFESFANSERYKTSTWRDLSSGCLRALLIQKDTKPVSFLILILYV